jgi:hypothetical protein
MPTLDQLLAWVQSGEGRLILAALLFLLMWAVKNVPYVKGLLTTPRRKQAASMLLALPPAVWLLVEGAPAVEVVSSALMIVLSANGLNTYRPSKVKAKPNDDK